MEFRRFFYFSAVFRWPVKIKKLKLSCIGISSDRNMNRILAVSAFPVFSYWRGFENQTWPVTSGLSNMADRRIVNKGESFDEKGVKNSWRWEWTEKFFKDERLGTHIRKIQKPGTAVCVICNREINYALRGRVALQDHCSTAKHKAAKDSLKGNASIDGKCFSWFLHTLRGL